MQKAKTGEAIPDELIAKMQATSSFNSGFETIELVAAALLDMEYHMLSDYSDFEANVFERAVAEKLSPAHLHIICHGYTGVFQSA